MGWCTPSACKHMHYAKLCNTASLRSTPCPVTADAIDFRPMGYGENYAHKASPSHWSDLEAVCLFNGKPLNWLMSIRVGFSYQPALEPRHPWIQKTAVACQLIFSQMCALCVVRDVCVCVSIELWNRTEDYLKKSFWAATVSIDESAWITQRLELWLVSAQDALNSKCYLKCII